MICCKHFNVNNYEKLRGNKNMNSVMTSNSINDSIAFRCSRRLQFEHPPNWICRAAENDLIRKNAFFMYFKTRCIVSAISDRFYDFTAQANRKNGSNLFVIDGWAQLTKIGSTYNYVALCFSQLKWPIRERLNDLMLKEPRTRGLVRREFQLNCV